MKLGNIIYYITKYTGIKYIVETYHAFKGTKCNCDERRKKFNNIKIKRCTTQLQQKNLTWSANCTHAITNIVFTSPAPAHQRQ